MSDQTIKSDAGKRQLTLVPTGITWAIAVVREYGNRKYSDSDSWKRVEPQRYRDAAYRHFLAYIEQPDSVDEESGILHLWHLACNIAFLIEMDRKESVDGSRETEAVLQGPDRNEVRETDRHRKSRRPLEMLMRMWKHR